MTIKTTKDHRAMWREISEAFYTPTKKMNDRQYFMTWNGLCSAASMFNYELFQMFKKNKWKAESAYFIPVRDYLPRGDLAYLFSTMTKKEFETLVEVEYPK